MKGTKELRTNKGITLIALVITIIVMLILVAVTISMAVNGGLFEYASNAGTKTNGAIANEQNLANLEAGMTVDQLIDKYTQNSNGGGDVCGKCTDGYITAYVCNKYGKSCDAISSSYEELGYNINCKDCNFNNTSRDYTAGAMKCPGCGSMVNTVLTVKLSDCSHYIYGNIPQGETYPCPDCTKVVCGKCTDGYITGYVCDRYGDECIDVSTNYAEEDSDIYICSSCGYEYGTDPTTSGLCDECGSKLVHKKIYCLDMCGHSVYAAPQKGNYPCPYCSVEGTITFRVNGTLYRAETGMTWRQWIESTNYYSGSYRLIGDKVGVGSEEVKYVCDAEEARVSADDPIDQDVDYDEVYW